jgi:hypothetical protein
MISRIFSIGGFSLTRPISTGSTPVDTWILATGFWDDAGFWDDTATWVD